jgi:glycyl-tRNA synthetase beta chain
VRTIAAPSHRPAARRRVLAEAGRQAAMLAKADLLTDMVGEFPELQGIMGGYYARHDGERSRRLRHRGPLQAALCRRRAAAQRDVGLVVALADKLETLAGLFGIGQLPTATRTRSRCAAMRWA